MLEAGRDVEPLVSIITPTFNHRPYIARCLQSTIAQSETRWEQIVVDDGSTDGTDEAVRGFLDSRIRYVRQEHRGVFHLAEAYNKALSMAGGELIAVLEGDDFWPADKLAMQIPAFQREDVVLSWGRIGITDEFGELERTVPPEWFVAARIGDRGRGESLRQLLLANYVSASTVMCRRSALLAIGGFLQPHGIPAVDYPTWLELARVGHFAPLNAVLGFWRQHPGQVTAQMKAEMHRIETLGWGELMVERLSEDERKALGLSASRGRQIDRHRRANLDYRAGRVDLRNGRKEQARIRFRNALRAGSASTRAKSVVGLALAAIGVDLERIAEVRNRIRGA